MFFDILPFFVKLDKFESYLDLWINSQILILKCLLVFLDKSQITSRLLRSCNLNAQAIEHLFLSQDNEQRKANIQSKKFI